MHVQQRLLKEEWPMRLGDHAAARVVTAGDLEDDPTNRQTIFNGLRVRMAVNTGMSTPLSCTSKLGPMYYSVLALPAAQGVTQEGMDGGKEVGHMWIC